MSADCYPHRSPFDSPATRTSPRPRRMKTQRMMSARVPRGRRTRGATRREKAARGGRRRAYGRGPCGVVGVWGADRGGRKEAGVGVRGGGGDHVRFSETSLSSSMDLSCVVRGWVDVGVGTDVVDDVIVVGMILDVGVATGDVDVPADECTGVPTADDRVGVPADAGLPRPQTRCVAGAAATAGGCGLHREFVCAWDRRGRKLELGDGKGDALGGASMLSERCGGWGWGSAKGGECQ
ncbi:hypothetical protein B0H10DRAFT_1370826 [Mycena sp. CBHHK59/15]|nr:hypothetical protein B0H10DRAFT_1370826 [Mycena sp. CBHHK59/15]